MKYYKLALGTILLALSYSTFGQNLPSLLTEKNINSTFSILAYDQEAQEWGIAVATDNIYVGNSTIYIQPGVGAFSVIAETNPEYGIKGIKKLIGGKSIEQAIQEVKAQDQAFHYRQVSGIDAEGNVYAFTGESLKYWRGTASSILGKQYVVMGNQLAEEVLSAMAATFEASKGTLAQRLLESLTAGQSAGGQLTGKQSAAVVVKGSNNEWYNQIDLRVDNSKNPIEELQVLMNYHYGRIRLNQAIFAHRSGNGSRAKKKLEEAELMLQGWTGIYSRIAAANVIMGNEAAAVSWIKKGLNENPNWVINLPAFYCLRENPELKSIIKPGAFNVQDWESAIGMLSNLGREMEIIELSKTLLAKEIESSYLYFLIGRSHYFEKDFEVAMQLLEKAIEMDQENIVAKRLLEEIKSRE